MPDTSHPTTEAPESVHRTVRLRLFPGDVETGILLTAIAGACRYVWNHMLADCEWRYARWKEMHVPALNWPEVREGKTAWAKAVRKKMGPGPSTSFFTLGLRFTELRHDPDHAWLKDYPYQVVRYSLKYLADAYARYKADPVNEGKPRFKARHCTVPAFTIPEAVRMDGDRLYVPRVGWLRLAGSNPYADSKPLTVRVRMEGTEQHPKWYAYVCCEVPAEQVKQPAAEGALGLDRNVGQATDSEGTVYAMPDTEQAGRADRAQAAGAEPQAGLGPQGPTAQVEPGPARERAVAEAAPQTGAQAGQCHAPGQPQAGGHGAHRGGGGSEHEGHDPVGQGHGGETRPGRSSRSRGSTAASWPVAGAVWSASWPTRPAHCGRRIRPTRHRRAAGAAMCTGTTGRRRRCSRAGPAGFV